MRTNSIVLALAVAVLAFALLFISSPGESPTEPEGRLSWRSLEDGLQLAGAEQKKLLVDVYTDWCGWCRKMDAEVYADGKVIDILNARFLVVKLNAESDDALTYDGTRYTKAQFVRALGISGYPSTVFFDEQGRPITVLPGFVDAGRFADILTYIGDNHYRTTSFDDYLASAGKTP